MKALLLITGLVLASLTACVTSGENVDRHLEPSRAATAFDESRYRSFQDYQAWTRHLLETEKVFKEDRHRDREIRAAMPFELPPASHCSMTDSKKPAKGILLIHGLSDTPFAVTDLGKAFSERCFLVRAILLPGHGTRPGDLLKIQREDWLNASQFALKTLKSDTDQVFVGGFSLGGLLSVLIGLDDPDVKGVFAFSPALKLNRSWQIRQAVWLRHFIDWADEGLPDDYARYEAMPLNGVAETYLLTEELREELDSQKVQTPVFMAQSADDPVIDTAANQQYFTRNLINSANRLIIYQKKPARSFEPDDKRVFYANSFLPDQQISGFSHQSIHVAPDNPHYGVEGDYRNCGENFDRNAEDVARCLTSKKLWRGEILDDGADNPVIANAGARLTFNPLFAEMMKEIDEFLHRQ